MICVDLARHNPAHILVVDDGTTNRDILTWPHLFLEPYRFACANRVTRLSALPALKAVYTENQIGPRWQHGCPRGLPGAPQRAGRKHRRAHRA